MHLDWPSVFLCISRDGYQVLWSMGQECLPSKSFGSFPWSAGNQLLWDQLPLVKLQAICLDTWSPFDLLTIYSLWPLVPGAPGLSGRPTGILPESLGRWGWVFLWVCLLGTSILTHLTEKFQLICEQNLAVSLFLLWESAWPVHSQLTLPFTPSMENYSRPGRKASFLLYFLFFKL